MNIQNIILRGLRGIGIAIAANVALYYIFSASGVFPEDFIIPQANGPLPVTAVIFATLMPLVIATLLYALLVRFTRRPNRIFLIISIIVLLWSFYPPFQIPNVPFSMAIGLNVLHLVAAASMVWSLTQPANAKTNAG
jgi:hypothetical protein